MTDEVMNLIAEETNRFAAQTIASVTMREGQSCSSGHLQKRRNGEVHWAPNLHGTCSPLYTTLLVQKQFV